MSIAQVRLYCTNCGFETTYQAMNEVPRLCPRCNRDSRPAYSWLRRKTPFLPSTIFLGLLFSLGFYDLVVTRAKELLWLPFVIFGLVFFSLPWMLVTLLKDWPKPPKGPRTISQIKWSRQDAAPEEVVGLKVVVKLEEHPLKRSFQSNIEGYRPIVMDKGQEDGWEKEKVYVLSPKKSPLEATHILFHPEWIRLKGRARKKLEKLCNGAYSYRASMEELLLNPDGPIREIHGRVYETKNPAALTASKIPYSLLTVMAYGTVKPARP